MAQFRGLKVHPSVTDGIAIPKQVVYTYTWNIENLVGEGVENTPLVYLRQANLPAVSFETEEMKTGHASYQFAKAVKWQDIKLSFYDTSGLGAKLDGMRDKVWSPDLGIRPAGEYMAETIINAYFYDGTPAYSWTLKNSWVKGVSFSQLTYESSGINNVDVVVAYSWAERMILA